MEYFILGMIMVQVLFPLMDGITAVILSALEALKGYFCMKVSEYNIKIRDRCYQEQRRRHPVRHQREADL